MHCGVHAQQPLMSEPGEEQAGRGHIYEGAMCDMCTGRRAVQFLLVSKQRHLVNTCKYCRAMRRLHQSSSDYTSPNPMKSGPENTFSA